MGMDLMKTFKNKRGQINVFRSEKDLSIIVTPQGFISKRLLQQFLQELKVITENQAGLSMNHIIDTSKVVFANPLNLFYMREIKKLKGIGWYMVIVPNPLLRILVFLTKWINKPDKVFKSMEDCQIFLTEQGDVKTYRNDF